MESTPLHLRLRPMAGLGVTLDSVLSLTAIFSQIRHARSRSQAGLNVLTLELAFQVSLLFMATHQATTMTTLARVT